MAGEKWDRRQRRTRAAVFDAFSELLAEKPYDRITIQEIIDHANVGRSTFYTHFGTKDDLLRALCGGLFDHIIGSALDRTHTHGLCPDGGRPVSIFCHILAHLQENDGNILSLLSGESNDLFLRDFRNGIKTVIRERLLGEGEIKEPSGVPGDFLVNHISGSFIEMVRWWLENGMVQTPEELDGYFRAVMAPLLEAPSSERRSASCPDGLEQMDQSRTPRLSQAPSAERDVKATKASSPRLISPRCGDISKTRNPNRLLQGTNSGTFPQQASPSTWNTQPRNQKAAHPQTDSGLAATSPERPGTVRFAPTKKQKRKPASHRASQCELLRWCRLRLAPQIRYSTVSGNALPKRPKRAAGSERVRAPMSMKFRTRCPGPVITWRPSACRASSGPPVPARRDRDKGDLRCPDPAPAAPR